ncbi:alpha/beta hydrolase [Litoribacillus peritrichatus]|uniref:Alpha/beta hydrolase n=1 Tax=Litoribacillus peritrichatus TaxID=718191 RepID=A0ABP7MDG9_9GAMM
MKYIMKLCTCLALFYCSALQAELLATSDWTPDVIYGFERKEFSFTEDYDGKVTANLVRMQSQEPSTKAVLYVHGFVDYFYQEELAKTFVEHGYNFYAIDLRKHGRSLLPNQHPNFMFSVEEFYEDLDAALDVIRNQDNNEKVLLNAHSTGGLITALYLEDRPESGIDAVAYNGPFFDINDAFININERLLIPRVLKTIAALNPYGATGMKIPEQYGQSLHITERGEWNYDLNWKPIISFPIYWGWLKGIMDAQQRLQNGINLNVPVLVMYSDKSSTPILNFWREEFTETDVILDVTDIDRISDVLGRHVTEIKIEGGVHDLALSKEPVRKQFYQDMMKWVNAYMN